MTKLAPSPATSSSVRASERPVHQSIRSDITATSSATVRSGASSVVAASLQENLMRCQHRDPFDIYELVNVLGEGSMGSVCKVRKRSSAVGGSARPSFVKRRASEKQPKPQNTCGPCFALFGNLYKLLPRRDNSIRLVTPDYNEDDYPTAASHHSNASSLVSFSSSSPSRSRSPSRDHHYALKSIHLDRCSSKTLQDELRNEVAILRELDHPHVTKAMETFEILADETQQHRLFLVLELCSGGDLYARDPYTEVRACEIVTSILSAVSYLHSKGIVHRDLKYENIMFVDKRPDAETKLIDFGLSQKFAADQDHMDDAVGTVYTMAPELLTGNYNSKADCWSVGVIAFMLLSSSMPFYGKTRYQVMKQICKGKFRFGSKRWAHVSKYGKGLVRHLLEHDPAERPSADRALKFTKTWRRHLLQEQEQSTDAVAPTTTSPQSTTKQKQLRWNPSTGSTAMSTFEEEDVEMMDKIQASMAAFAQYATLKKLALMVIAYKSTASEIGWLRSTFNRFDLLQNGEISLEEFTEALSELYDYAPAEIEALFTGMDVDGTGSVHYTEFLAATIEAHGSIEEDRIADAFDRIDCDDSGYITIHNLRDFLGNDVPQSYLEAIIDDADLVRDHRISYDEFLELWDSKCYDTLCSARREVAERRVKRSETLIFSFSASDSGTTSDETDEEEEEEEGPEMAAPQRDSVMDDVSSKTPIINNTRCGGPVECFSQRKALSLRVGWM